MCLSRLCIWVCWAPLFAMVLGSHVEARSANSVGHQRDETPFLKANDLAMSRMMSGMAIKPSGDVDVDFAETMIPHHQGAIDMAVAELRFGHDEKLRRIAQEIIIDQQQEIAAMRLALDRMRSGVGPAPLVADPATTGTPAISRPPMITPMEHTQ